MEEIVIPPDEPAAGEDDQANQDEHSNDPS
jgi:hypothetical protein